MNRSKLSAILNKEDYIKYNNKEVLFQGRVVKVITYESENRQGSYERGLKWSHRKYGLLIRKGKTKYSHFISANHGETWVELVAGERIKSAIRQSKNKVILGNTTTKEFAFEGIQEINRKWDGPNYRWRR